MSEPERQLHTAIQRVEVPKIRETIGVTETEVLDALRLLWPDQIPSGATAYGLDCDSDPDASPDDAPVLTVTWLRDPAEGEYESLKDEEETKAVMGAFAAAEEEDDDDEYEEYEDDDGPTPRCSCCKQPLGSVHTSSCVRGVRRRIVSRAACQGSQPANQPTKKKGKRK